VVEFFLFQKESHVANLDYFCSPFAGDLAVFTGSHGKEESATEESGHGDVDVGERAF